MQEDRERWQELAELAANEQDPDKLLALVHEINLILDRKITRLMPQPNSKPDLPE